MAVQIIAFPVVARQNTNDGSSAYGKWFLTPYWPETLNLRGLIERVAFSQSVYSRDIVEGVITKLTEVMVELLKSGQPVKWDGLGTFTPNIHSSGVNDTASVSVEQIKGVSINFIPENAKGEQLTSKKLKDLCTFDILGRIETTKKTKTSANGKEYATYERILYPLHYEASEAGNTGGGSQGGGDNSGGGSQSGGGTNGGGTNGDDDDERPGAGG
jgi:predicted histone-like DNA-binding protein